MNIIRTCLQHHHFLQLCTTCIKEEEEEEEEEEEVVVVVVVVDEFGGRRQGRVYYQQGLDTGLSGPPVRVLVSLILQGPLRDAPIRRHQRLKRRPLLLY